MKLRCHESYTKCPRYQHTGAFYPDDKTVKRLLPDLSRCADCMAFASPQSPHLREDLLQTASIVLIEKGPKFNPTHQSGANFGTFIRPQICGNLLNVKRKELEHHRRELPYLDAESDVYEDMDAETRRGIGWLNAIPDLNSEFEDALVQDISFQEALPELLQALTEREREVFDCLRGNQQNYEIAEALQLSVSRVSRLVKQVILKLTHTGQKLGLAE